jgi:hypothetical protein
MRKRTHRIPGAILMILLLTAQTMGWCRAYVCDCSGSPEVTMTDHCHGHSDHHEDHDHEIPCHHQCGSHHDHELLASSFSATQVKDQFADALFSSGEFAVAILPPLSLVTLSQEVSIRPPKRGHDPSVLLSCRPRHTVALLI